jgi:hypothetical protein
MKITLEHAAQILTHTPDQVMFMVQSGDLKSYIDDDTMAWRFELDEVLELKAKLDEAKTLLKEVNPNGGNNTSFTD